MMPWPAPGGSKHAAILDSLRAALSTVDGMGEWRRTRHGVRAPILRSVPSRCAVVDLCVLDTEVGFRRSGDTVDYHLGRCGGLDILVCPTSDYHDTSDPTQMMRMVCDRTLGAVARIGDAIRQWVATNVRPAALRSDSLRTAAAAACASRAHTNPLVRLPSDVHAQVLKFIDGGSTPAASRLGDFQARAALHGALARDTQRGLDWKTVAPPVCRAVVVERHQDDNEDGLPEGADL
jgi:hypothetical protein